MFDRPKAGQHVILVHVDFHQVDSKEDLAEFQLLVASAGAIPVATLTTARRAPDPKYFIGRGKAEELCEAVKTHHAELIIFNHTLSPSQERNIERAAECRVLDRTGLILDIFAARARTFEGKLQVELAQLQHLSTRLVRGWTHLERQKGGIGLRGPGETQLETDRRLLRARIKMLHARLAKVRQQREQNRQARQKAALPSVSIVGYTNAGKSTLFNRLCGELTYTADKLFATLDPTLRRLPLPSGGEAILADTVGFIRHLPHDLVESFRATLEETREADLLLHVIDVSHANYHDNMQEVMRVLDAIGANDVPQLEVYNKIDEREGASAEVIRDHSGKPVQVWLSAKTGEGLALLQAAISERLFGELIGRTVCLAPREAKLRALLYAHHAVIEEHVDEQGYWHLHIMLPAHLYELWIARVAHPEPPSRPLS